VESSGQPSYLCVESSGLWKVQDSHHISAGHGSEEEFPGLLSIAVQIAVQLMDVPILLLQQLMDVPILLR